MVLLGIGICYLYSRDRRRRRHLGEDDQEKDYVMVDPEFRRPGEGSPRGSGEEVDPFLQQSRGAPAVPPKRRGGAKPGPFKRKAAPTEAKNVPMDGSVSTNSSGKNTSSTGSGYGSLLDRPTIHFDPEDEYRPGYNPSGSEPLHTLVEESALQASDDGNTDFGPPMPPPRLVDPESRSSRDSSRNSKQTHRSSYPIDGDEPAMLATARRVRVEDLGPRTSPLSSNSPLDAHEEPHPSTSAAARHSGGLLGLGSLAGLGRFSNMFKSLDSSSRRHSRLPSDDLESSQALLGDVSPEMTDQRLLGPAMSSMSDRPMSSVSAKSAASGATVYHDAQSSIPSTPVLAGVPVLTPPPRALAAPNQAELGIWSPGSVERMRHHASVPGDSSVAETSTAPSVPTSPVTPVFTGQIDILDMPAPRGISPFTSASSMKDTPSNSSFGTKLLSYPPGLIKSMPPRTWGDISGTTSSMGSFAGGSDGNTGISIDVLEEEPPSAGDGWRSLAGVVPSGVDEVGRRTTFGLPHFIHQPGHSSEQGSLHSMRSHLSPGSRSSAGSAPASLRDPSTGSGSSKSHGTAGHSSLAHSGSISSDGRHRYRVQGPMSPALSAFGPASPAASLVSPHRAHFSAASSMHDMGVRRGATDDSGPISPLPWAGGLDPNWKPT